MNGDDPLPLVPGTKRDVVILQRVAKVYNKLPAKDRGRLESIMKKYADGEDLHDTQFNWESREKAGDRKGTEVGVCAFKGWKKRVYGVRLTYQGKSFFVCSEIDTDKKQDKADQACLRRAAQNVRHLIENGWTT